MMAFYNNDYEQKYLVFGDDLLNFILLLYALNLTLPNRLDFKYL